MATHSASETPKSGCCSSACAAGERKTLSGAQQGAMDPACCPQVTKEAMTTVADIEKKALAVLSPDVGSYYQFAFRDSFQENLDVYHRYRIRPRVMRDVSNRQLRTTILGNSISFPVCISPTARHILAHKDGEVATAKGAAEAGVAYTLSMWTSKSPAEVSQAAPEGLRFLGLQLLKDRAVTMELVQKAEQLGYKALVVTVDHVPSIIMSERAKEETKDDRLNTKVFEDISTGMLVDGKQIPYTQLRVGDILDGSPTWEYLRWLKMQTNLPIVAKGILSGADAEEAIDAGVSAILVSNHGARQQDGLISTLDALPDIVQTVRGRCEVYVDGGIRTGSDVFKGLALGARAVFIGRPSLYGLVHKGSDGVKEVLDVLRRELDTTMALTGCRSVEDITPQHIVHVSRLPSRIGV